MNNINPDNDLASVHVGDVTEAIQRATIAVQEVTQGTVIHGNVQSGNDFVARDKRVAGDDVHGDKVGRDRISAETYTHIETVIVTPSLAEPPSTEVPAPGESPYKGLQYFDMADADLFFGREKLVTELISHLRQNRFLAVVGASGSGKSSIIRAGLLPALQRGGPLADGTLPPTGCNRWPIYVLTPTARPLEALAASLTRTVESVTATATLIDDLRNDARSLHLYARRLVEAGNHLLLVVDQFEELFTLCRERTERAIFINNLLTAAVDDGVTTVVITLRADFYAHCSEFDNLRQALESKQKYIGPMSLDELRRAIEEPARQRSWVFEPGLVDLLLDDVGSEPGALPLLSHALLETWQRRRGRMLTFAGYTESGRVQGAIAHTAETVFNQLLTSDQQLMAKNIFLRLTNLGEGSEVTRRRATLDELMPKVEDRAIVEAVLKQLADARLITTHEDEVEVAHEALIREWDTLKKWLQDDLDGLRLHRRLIEAAQSWAMLARDTGALYRGVRLAQTLEWAESHRVELSTLECEFLSMSAALCGETDWKAGNYASAKQHLYAAFAIAPMLVAPYFTLYHLLIEINEFAEAYEIYTRIMANTKGADGLLPHRYRIDAIIGKSELGVIYRAWDEQTNQDVVITLTAPTPVVISTEIDHLRDVYRQLHSPHISRILDLERYLSRYLIVTELVEGETLRSHLEQYGPLSASAAFAILDEVAAGLEDAHAQGLPHLNLNPFNILITSAGVKLIHFGTVRLAIALLPPDEKHVMRFQSSYLSPEQFAGEAAGYPSDIYTLGILITELFTGQAPTGSLLAHPSQINPAADEALDLLVERTQQREPTLRFGTITFMRQELRRIASLRHPGNFGQRIRWVLAMAGQSLTWARQPKVRPFVFALLAGAVLSEALEIDPILRIFPRMLLLLASQIYPISMLFAWRVRDFARTSGYVSLIQTGQGMGIVLGGCMALWNFQNSARGFQSIGLLLPPQQFAMFIFVAAIATILVALIVFYSMWLAADLAHKLRWGYLRGFYGTFLVWCFLILLQTGILWYFNLNGMWNFS